MIEFVLLLIGGGINPGSTHAGYSVQTDSDSTTSPSESWHS